MATSKNAASVTPSPPVKSERQGKDQSYPTQDTHKCKSEQQGLCNNFFADGAFKTVHNLTNTTEQCEIHELCMKELSEYGSDYVAAIMRPEPYEPLSLFWGRTQSEIKTQMDLYTKTDPHLTPNIPAIVIVNGNRPSIIMKESFVKLNIISPPNYVVLIMQRIIPPDINFDIDVFTSRIISAGLFWWDCKTTNSGFLTANGNQVAIDCDNDFIYFFDENDKKDKGLERACKIFMMLEYSMFRGIGQPLPYTLDVILVAIELISKFENKIIKQKYKPKTDRQTPINTLRFYLQYFTNLAELNSIDLLNRIPLYFNLKKEGGYRKRRRTTRKRYRRRAKTKMANVGSLRSRSN